MQDRYVGDIGDYLLRPDKWRAPDPQTFNALRKIMGRFFHMEQDRSVAAIEQSGLLRDATTFWSGLTVCQGRRGRGQAEWRGDWAWPEHVYFEDYPDQLD